MDVEGGRGRTGRRAYQAIGGIILLLLSLGVLVSMFWTVPATIGLGVASLPLSMLQGLAAAVAATYAGRLLGRAFPKRRSGGEARSNKSS